MPFDVPTLEELHAALVADSQNRLTEDDHSKESDNWKRLRTKALAVTSLHAHIDAVHDDLLPDTAGGSDTEEGGELERLGTIYDVIRKKPTPAKKADALRLVGTAASTFSSGSVLVHNDGTRYQLNESGAIPSAGFIDVDVLAIDTGSKTRKNKGEVLTFLSAPSGVQNQAELQLDMNEDGDDLETIAALRTRILDKIAQPGMGGNANDYKQWAEEVTGIDHAFVYALRNGLGTVDVAALHNGSGEPRHLTQAERDELKTYIDTKRPVSMKGLRILSTTTLQQSVEILITPEDGADFAFDWDDSTPPTVSSYNSTTREVTLQAARPASMAVGDRVVFKPTGYVNEGAEEVKVEALNGGDTTKFTIEKAPKSGNPVNGQIVYSGGPLVEPIRQAIITHCKEIGPTRGTYAATTWEGTLRTSSLFKLAQLTEGVLDSQLVQPTVNITGTDTPANDFATVVIVGYVLIRKGP